MTRAAIATPRARAHQKAPLAAVDAERPRENERDTMQATKQSDAPAPAQALTRGLNARHIRFMALGSAIGTGLFYGSAKAIQAAGPSVLLAYLIAGAAVYMVMRALGEDRSGIRYPARSATTPRNTWARSRAFSPAGPMRSR